MATLWDLERKPRLLVVENDREVGNILKVYLTSLGAEVNLTDRGNDGLTRFFSQVFDLVLLDVMLPDLNGFEVIKSIKESGSRVPVFFLSQDPNVKQGLELGADDYILMPFDIEELAFRIKVGLRYRGKDLRSAG
jgi:two-component system, OmpR family, copper resistance phosphate regulon response regulator CusR